MDVVESAIGKLGKKMPFEKMCAEFYKAQLEEKSDLTFTVYAHSQGGMHMSNVSDLLEPTHKERIELLTFGSATIVSKEAFKKVRNFVSRNDLVPMTSSKYVQACMGNVSNVEFLPPTYLNPIKEHFLCSPTYWDVISGLGRDFRNAHAH